MRRTVPVTLDGGSDDAALLEVTATLENVRDRAERADDAIGGVNAAADEGIAALEELVSRVEELGG